MSKKKVIDLFYQPWTIVFKEEIPDSNGRFVWGNCDSINRVITLRTKDVNGKPMTQPELERTLIHELIHAISACGAFWDDISETQVEFISVCLHRVLSQLKMTLVL